MAINRILVTRNAQGYHAQFIGPHAAEVVGLFGTDTIPTPFTARADERRVLAVLAEKNPDCEVLLAESARRWRFVAGPFKGQVCDEPAR